MWVKARILRFFTKIIQFEDYFKLNFALKELTITAQNTQEINMKPTGRPKPFSHH